MQSARDPAPDRYNGLTTLVDGLPANAYFDPRRYDLELGRIWYRQWFYAGRSTDVEQARAFRTVELGDQRLLLVRDDSGTLRGFHNTCRHRGAALCLEETGLLRSNTIICPYHAWAYDLQGHLQRTSSKILPTGFDANALPLYRIHVHEWRGFIFVALSADPPPFERIFDPPLSRLDAWPLEELVVGHVLVKTLQCNWKIFWENFNECLHCPAVHPSLSQLVPIYGRGLVREGDDPKWRQTADDPDPKYKGGLRRGASSWSSDGQTTGIPFAGMTDSDRRRGSLFVTVLPSLFIVAHLDYVRIVRVRPLAPEQTELRVEYLFSRESLASPGFNLSNIVDFTNQVMTEDANICELNQRGLRASPHLHGVVMPEEYLIRQFHEWIASELART